MGKLFAGMLLLIAALFAAWAYMVSDEKRFQVLEKWADAILDRLLSD